MQRDKVVLYVHLVWTTWDRLPLIPIDQERALYDCLAAIAVKNGCQVVAINGMEDHVHLLLALPSTIAVGFLAQQLKGGSSHFANNQMKLEATLKWRGSYAAFSVSRWDVPKVAAYIQRQKQHHSQNTIIAQLEADD